MKKFLSKKRDDSNKNWDCNSIAIFFDTLAFSSGMLAKSRHNFPGLSREPIKLCLLLSQNKAIEFHSFVIRMLKEKIQLDLQASLKVKDEMKRLVLGSLFAAIQNKEIEKRTVVVRKDKFSSDDELARASQLNDDEIIQIIQSETKKRYEAVELYKKGNREELARKEESEIKILKLYLPEQMDEQALRRVISEAITTTGAKKMQDMGRVIGEVLQKVRGKASGSQVSQLVKELLS